VNNIEYIVHFYLAMSTTFSGATLALRRKPAPMLAQSLFDGRGNRKYLTSTERRAVAVAALRMAPPIATFVLTLLHTGARISELLALNPERVDCANGIIVFETLKRRKRGLYRAVPVPSELLRQLDAVHDVCAAQGDPEKRGLPLWDWGRTTAWKHVKFVMRAAKINETLAMPRAARHAFGVNAVQSAVALNVVQRWMGHARIETTAIYADVIGKEEQALARRTWVNLQKLPQRQWALRTPREQSPSAPSSAHLRRPL
jgi:integrase/recombinase XerD